MSTYDSLKKRTMVPSIVASLNFASFEKLPPSPTPPNYLKPIPHFSETNHLNINPGYISEKSVTTSNALQSCLDKGIASFKKQFNKRFGLALVDLTGDKLYSPEFAQYNSYRAIYGASQSKTGALLGAHQLRYDLRRLAAEFKKKNNQDINAFKAQAIQTFAPGIHGAKLHDKFVISTSPEGFKVDFTEGFKKEFIQMMRISNNRIASKVIDKVGFNYINSTLWQLGIYDKSRGGGLWVGRGYAGGKYWHRDPVSNLSHGINPFSLARLMTLLAQKRLVSEDASESMLTYLSNTRFRIKFVKGLIRLGVVVNKPHKDPTKRAVVYRKSGTMKGGHRFSHDATLILRTVCADKACKKTKDLRYVATGASELQATWSMWLFGQKMDYCIRKNNGV